VLAVAPGFLQIDEVAVLDLLVVGVVRCHGLVLSQVTVYRELDALV
jgi:hypothetical protein